MRSKVHSFTLKIEAADSCELLVHTYKTLRCHIRKDCGFSLVSWDEVRLSTLGTSVTNWPVVPAPNDR
jgi:hypothetical protein